MLNLDGRTTSWREESRLLEIRPGYSSESKIVFPGEGHDYVNRVTSDLIFKIVELPHEVYQRKGNNLIYNLAIPLSDALNSQNVTIKTLDNRTLRVPIDHIIR